MKLTYKSASGRYEFEQDGVDRKSAFELIAVLDELFGEEVCGCCGGKEVRHQVTHPGEYTYYKLKCMNPECGAVLDFGQNKDMKGLFVKKWDSEARAPLPNGGWYVWDGQRQEGGGRQPDVERAPGSQSRPGNNQPQQRTNYPSKPAPNQGGGQDNDPVPF